jgi:hypothetical protein
VIPLPPRRWVLVFGLLSCKTPGVPCTSTAECGELQACIEERCEDVACLASTDCEIETWCNPASYTCEPGCSTSDDCIVGDRCDTIARRCVSRSCRDTQLDCDLGERCTDGVCERDPEPYCEPCNRNEDCGPTGICAALTDSRRGYCILECSPEAFDPCPAGLQCSFQQSSIDDVGEFRCIGLCDRLEE